MATISAEHPFGIEAIAANVFKYLPLNEIIKQRLVCKLWHKIGTELAIQQVDDVQIKIGSNFSLDVPNPSKTVENFLQMQARCPIKFTNFATYYFESNLGGKIPKAEETAWLFSQHGHHMKKIKLDLHGENCWRFLSDILLTLAPNAEELHLDGYPNEKIIEKKLFPQTKPVLKLKSIILHSEDEYEDPIYSRELLTDLFQCSPHLERLTIGLDTDQCPGDKINDHDILVLTTLASKGNICNLTHLSLSDCVEDTFKILADHYKRAPFKEFSTLITQIHSNEMLMNIATFLDDHKNTWTSLHITFPFVDEFMDGINFPKMINLTNLSISVWDIMDEEPDEIRAPLEMLNFGRQFPNLVTLNLSEDPKSDRRSFFDLEEWFSEHTTPVLSLKNLSLPPLFDASILRRMGRIFPNVIKLDLTVQMVEVLKELWVTWPEMKQLEMTIIPTMPFGSTSLDSIFTGIPDVVLKTLPHCRMNTVAVKSFPFIGGLKKLTHLLIKGPSRMGLYKVNESFNAGIKITNETARFALANLKELVFLRISKNRHEISPACIQDLCYGLGLHQVGDGDALRLVKYEWQKKICIYDW
ncbi:hypothetical protein HA402_011208 [Bradysia odoriphaga]|nr:hypothetical protein HA402_011208 [Bradysia odoriphaga]